MPSRVAGMEFGKFGLAREILGAVQKAGYVKPTPVQAAAIPKVMRGEDLIGIAQTGTGKTAAFVLPMLQQLCFGGGEPGVEGGEERGGREQREGDGERKSQWIGRRGKHWRPTRALILAPTRELALQIVENVRIYGASLPVRVAAIFGGVEEEAQVKALQKGVDIVVATPGRLMALMLEKRMTDFERLETLVLDEADRMLHMGFLPDIEKIVAELPRQRQTLMFSATFPKEVESLARKFMRQPKTVQIGGRSNTAETVKQEVHEVPPHLKTRLLVELLKQPGFTRVLVFVRMKDGANRLTAALQEAGVRVVRLHSSRSQEQRLKALQDFKEGKVQVMVATDIVARGIDIEGVSQVVNYDFPVNPEDYVHRIGRTGRAEQEGVAISFAPKDDMNLLGITEMAIGMRLEKKRLRGFDYHAPMPKHVPGAPVAKKDWRKRERQTQERRKTQDLKTQEERERRGETGDRLKTQDLKTREGKGRRGEMGERKDVTAKAQRPQRDAKEGMSAEGAVSSDQKRNEGRSGDFGAAKGRKNGAKEEEGGKRKWVKKVEEPGGKKWPVAKKQPFAKKMGGKKK